MSNEPIEGDFSLTEPESAPAGKKTSPRVKRDAETLGEGAGGFLGGATGMSIGAIGGPVGLVIGGLAGALGGWWVGREIGDAFTKGDDDAFRRHFETVRGRLADRSYEDARPAYVAGHLAGRNPEYRERSFEDIEPDLRCGWSGEVVNLCGEWPSVRHYARAAFERARGVQFSDTDDG
jgi:hypothetical protein